MYQVESLAILGAVTLGFSAFVSTHYTVTWVECPTTILVQLGCFQPDMFGCQFVSRITWSLFGFAEGYGTLKGFYIAI